MIILLLASVAPCSDLCTTHIAIGGAKDEASGLISNGSAVGVGIADFKTFTYQKIQTVISPSVLFFRYPGGC